MNDVPEFMYSLILPALIGIALGYLLGCSSPVPVPQEGVVWAVCRSNAEAQCLAALKSGCVSDEYTVKRRWETHPSGMHLLNMEARCVDGFIPFLGEI